MLKIAGITSIWLGITLLLLAGCGSLPTSAQDSATKTSAGPKTSDLAKGSSKSGVTSTKEGAPVPPSQEPKINKSLASEACPTLEVVSRILQKDPSQAEKTPAQENGQGQDKAGKKESQIQTVSFQASDSKAPKESIARDKAFPLSAPPAPTKPPMGQKGKVFSSVTDTKLPESAASPPSTLPPSLEHPTEAATGGGNPPKAQPAGQDHFQFTKLVLCKKVEGFGQYEPIKPGYKFNPGSRGQPGERVLLYAELNNPPGRLVDGLHRTCLCGEVQILRQNDQALVCKLGFPGREDCSRTPRKDHHLVYSFHVPPGLPPGSYCLRVNARESSLGPKDGKDKAPEGSSTTDNKASATVDFQVDVGRTGSESSLESKPRPAVGGMTP